jgi:hypothetical protein
MLKTNNNEGLNYVGGDVWSWSVGGQENYENYKVRLHLILILMKLLCRRTRISDRWHRHFLPWNLLRGRPEISSLRSVEKCLDPSENFCIAKIVNNISKSLMIICLPMIHFASFSYSSIFSLVSSSLPPLSPRHTNNFHI